jgi:hypothetical protein
MSAKLLYRVAAVVFVLFAAGHTAGFLTFRPESTQGLAVYNAMDSVTFDFNGSVRSYGEFYTGFGLQVTACLLFFAVLAWQLGNLATSQPGTLRVLAWTFVAVQLAIFILSVRYFFIVPTVLSAIILVCLFWAAWRLPHSAA